MHIHTQVVRPCARRPRRRHRFDYDAAHMICKRHRRLPKNQKTGVQVFMFEVMDACDVRTDPIFKMCIFLLLNKLVGGKITCAEH